MNRQCVIQFGFLDINNFAGINVSNLIDMRAIGKSWFYRIVGVTRLQLYRLSIPQFHHSGTLMMIIAKYRSIILRTEDLIKHETITQNFYFRSDELERRIVALRNDLSSSERGEKDKLEFRVLLNPPSL